MTPYCPIAEINLTALRANYRLLAAKAALAECAAVVKANAYGLGVEGVVPALAEEGCNTFFVVTLPEGMEVRTLTRQARIGLFHGVNTREEADTAGEHDLIPVLNTLQQIDVWRRWGQGREAIVHVDTGMTRLGLSLEEITDVAIEGLNIGTIMSHLACAGTPTHPLNMRQLERFSIIKQRFPQKRFSLANSSGIFLGKDYHADMVRPGVALYGSNPLEDAENPMQSVLTLHAPVLQVRELTQAESIGYHATRDAVRGAVIATVGIGYADGLKRSLSNCGKVHINGYEAPIIGIVSMDSTMIDITHLPKGVVRAGDRVEFINSSQPIDTVAERAGTISYEILTGLGLRVKRVYKT